MDLIIGTAVAVIALMVMGGLALRADMSERFSLDWQTQHQKLLHARHDLNARERTLLGWVYVLVVTVVVLLLVAAVSVIGFLAEDAKGYGNANEAVLQASFFGMTMAPILGIVAAYHLAGMIVRLRAWRRIIVGESDEGRDGPAA